MPNINNDSIIVAYTIADAPRRNELHNFMIKSLGATQQIGLVYEFVYRPNITGKYADIVTYIRQRLRPELGDRAFFWDLHNGSLRRMDIHQISLT
jgi:hypothetical protein